MLIGDRGLFSIRLKYLQQRQKRCLATESESPLNEESSIEAVSAEEDLQYMKSAVITNTNMEMMIAKLDTTRELRRTMLRDKDIDMREHFQFFFSHAVLVSINIHLCKQVHENLMKKYDYYGPHKLQLALDFEQMFQSIDSNAFKTLWPGYAARLREISATRPDYTIGTNWSEQVEDVLLLLKIFPAKPNKRTINFHNLSEKLIVFSVVSSKKINEKKK